jgi:hypothetical protein
MVDPICPRCRGSMTEKEKKCGRCLWAVGTDPGQMTPTTKGESSSKKPTDHPAHPFQKTNHHITTHRPISTLRKKIPGLALLLDEAFDNVNKRTLSNEMLSHISTSEHQDLRREFARVRKCKSRAAKRAKMAADDDDSDAMIQDNEQLPASTDADEDSSDKFERYRTVTP